MPKVYFRSSYLFGILGACTFLASFSASSSNKDETDNKSQSLVVYSARNEQLIQPVFAAYEKASGVKIEFITDDAAPLIEKLRSEGKHTRADILLTVDAGNLWMAANNGLLRKFETPTLLKNIPEHLRDPNSQWYGLSVRARTVAYNTKKVKADEIKSYEDLASPTWKGRVCLRTAKKVYNQSLIAMMIAEHGAEATENIVRGWVANLAIPVLSNDTDVLKAIVDGRCDVGIVNTYYYGRLMKEQPDLPLALGWPNQSGSGVHVNISGAGITTHAKNPEAAGRFLEWLSSPAAQNIFADANMEYPANSAVEPAEEVQEWGKFKANRINLAKAGTLQRDAIMLMDRAGYR